MVLQWQAAAELMKKVESKGFALVNKTKPNSPSHVRVAPAVCVFTGVFLVGWLIICAYVYGYVCFCLFLSILLCVSYRCISVHLFKISVTQICGHHGMFVYAQPSSASRTKKPTSSPSGSQYEDVVPM